MGRRPRALETAQELAVLPRPLGDATPRIVLIEIGEAPPGPDTFVGYHGDLRSLTRMR